MSNDHHKPAERRPITSRETALAKRIAGGLARLGIRPNTISMLGMAAGVLAGLALAGTAIWTEWARWCWMVGAVLIQLRLLANMLDGMVAVQTHQASALGELYNEIPDRVSDVCTLVGLGYAAGSDVTLGYVAACLAVFVAYLRAVGKAAGAHQEFCGPLAKPQRMFFATVAALYGAAAPSSWPLSPAANPGRDIAYWTLALIIVGCVFTALRRLRRIAVALRSPPTP